MDLATQMLKQYKSESSSQKLNQTTTDQTKPEQKLIEIGKEVEGDKKWKKDMEAILKDIYASIRDDPIFRAKETVKKKELTKTNSAWALTNSIFSDKSKSEKQSPLNESPEPTLSKPEPICLLQGILIRKHIQEGEEKAKNRRWVKYWTKILASEERGLELVMIKVSNASTEYSPTELKDIPENVDSIPTTPDSPPLLSPQQSPTHNIHNHNYKLSSSEPEIISLIHSYTLKDHKVPTRPHVFKLFTADNHIYLFEAPSNTLLSHWIKTINYNAALKTKEPIRGSFGNIEYGWSDLNVVNLADGKEKVKPEQKFGQQKPRKITKWPLTPISTRSISTRPPVFIIV